MKTHSLTLLLLVVTGLAQAQSQPDAETEKAAILEVINQQTEHFFANDFEAYQNHWAHAPYVIRMDEDGGRVTGWDSLQASYKNMMERRAAAGVETREHKITDEQVQVQGNSAWVVHNQHNEVVYQGETISYDQWLVRSLEKQDGEWKVTYMMVGTPPARDFTALESELNTVGYRMLALGNTDEAIRLFKLTTDYYPESSNAFDSLGEAYMEAGDTEQAVESYTRALKLNPENTNAKAMIDKLNADNQKDDRPG